MNSAKYKVRNSSRNASSIFLNYCMGLLVFFGSRTQNAQALWRSDPILEIRAIGWVVTTLYRAENLPDNVKSQHSTAFEAVATKAVAGMAEQGIKLVKNSVQIVGYIDTTCPDDNPNAPSAHKKCLDVVGSIKVKVIRKQSKINDDQSKKRIKKFVVENIHTKIDDGTLQAELDIVSVDHPFNILEGFGPTQKTLVEHGLEEEL